MGDGIEARHGVRPLLRIGINAGPVVVAIFGRRLSSRSASS